MAQLHTTCQKLLTILLVNFFLQAFLVTSINGDVGQNSCSVDPTTTISTTPTTTTTTTTTSTSPSTTRSTTTKPTTTTTTVKSTTVSKIFRCSQEGRFPDPVDCKKYHVCMLSNKVYSDNIFYCQSGTVYCAKYNQCYYEINCPCFGSTTPQPTTTTTTTKKPIATPIFYEHIDFEGLAYTAPQNWAGICNNLPDYLNDKVSSMNTAETCVSACTDADCQGECQQFYLGSPNHENIHLLHFDDRISSFKSC